MTEVRPHISNGNINTNPSPSEIAAEKNTNISIYKNKTFIRNEKGLLPLSRLIQQFLMGWVTAKKYPFYNYLSEAKINWQGLKNGNYSSVSLQSNFLTPILWLIYHNHNNYNLFLNLDKEELLVSTDFKAYRNTRGIIDNGVFVPVSKFGDKKTIYLSKIFSRYGFSGIKDNELKKKLEDFIYSNYNSQISESSKINYPTISELSVWIDATIETAKDLRDNLLPDAMKFALIVGGIVGGFLILKDKILK
jgi:hypothetical protein